MHFGPEDDAGVTTTTHASLAVEAAVQRLLTHARNCMEPAANPRFVEWTELEDALRVELAASPLEVVAPVGNEAQWKGLVDRLRNSSKITKSFVLGDTLDEAADLIELFAASRQPVASVAVVPLLNAWSDLMTVRIEDGELVEWDSGLPDGTYQLTPATAPGGASSSVSARNEEDSGHLGGGGDVEFGQFLSDVVTAAGLLEHGKQCKALAERMAKAAFKLRTDSASVHLAVAETKGVQT